MHTQYMSKRKNEVPVIYAIKNLYFIIEYTSVSVRWTVWVYYTEWNKITRQAFTDGRRDQNKNFRWGTYVRKRLGSTQFGLEVVPDIRRLYLFIPFPLAA